MDREENQAKSKFPRDALWAFQPHAYIIAIPTAGPWPQGQGLSYLHTIVTLNFLIYLENTYSFLKIKTLHLSHSLSEEMYTISFVP